MIESVNNEKIKIYAKLNDKKYRQQTNLFLIPGEHLVNEAIKKNLIKEIFLLKGENNPYGDVTYVNDKVLKKLSTLNTPPKVIAVCHKPNNHQIKGNIIMIDDLIDPGNLGTIIRSAVAFNYETIIISPKAVDIYNPKVIKATEGMFFHINFIINDLKPMIKELKEKDYLIIGSDVKNGKQPNKLNQKHVIIIGNEAQGINQGLSGLIDYNLHIKMSPLCESLNASVSASILMYELNKGDY